METDRIAEIWKRTIVHCQEAKEDVKKHQAACQVCGRPEDFPKHVARITAYLQTQIARDAAVLCAEEIVSCTESVLRGVPILPSDGNSSPIRKGGKTSDVGAGVLTS